MLWAIRGASGVYGCQGYIGWQVDWEPNHIGPQLRVPTLSVVPWGSDLPGQGQASERNELCRPLYTFGTIFCNSFHICIYTTSSHILTHNIKKCYMDYFLCRPIYAYLYTISLTYYDTMVLIMKNYFSHHISELGTSYCKCQADMMWFCFLHFSWVWGWELLLPKVCVTSCIGHTVLV